MLYVWSNVAITKSVLNILNNSNYQSVFCTVFVIEGHIIWRTFKLIPKLTILFKLTDIVYYVIKNNTCHSFGINKFIYQSLIVKWLHKMCSGSIGVGSSSFSKGWNNIDKTTVVLHATLGTTCPPFLLLLLINLNKILYIIRSKWNIFGIPESLLNQLQNKIPLVSDPLLYQHEPKNHGLFLFRIDKYIKLYHRPKNLH